MRRDTQLGVINLYFVYATREYAVSRGQLRGGNYVPVN